MIISSIGKYNHLHKIFYVLFETLFYVNCITLSILSYKPIGVE
jgi:preprotein translocase subunit SecG